VKRFVLRSLSGLEPVVMAEVQLRFHRRASWIGPRDVAVVVAEEEAAAAALELVQLATVDDAFLEVGAWGPAARAKAGLAEIVAMVEGTDPGAAARLVLGWRGARWPNELWLSASVLGDRRYSRFDVEDAVGPLLAARVGLPRMSQRPGPTTRTQVLAFRVTLDQRRSALLVRLANQPLHRRLYWRGTRQGALYPPLAAAMGMLADLQPDQVVLDPFCGTGTIPIEVQRLAGRTVTVLASDLAQDALAATRANADTAGARIGLFRADIARMPLRPHSIDRVVSNPPWNLQVRWRGRHDGGEQFNEVLKNHALLVMLELVPQAPERLGGRSWSTLATLPVSLRGQHPMITVYGLQQRPAAVGTGDGHSIPLDELILALRSSDAAARPDLLDL
jgi:tRNA (guanine6-N2)-methyltransferase